MAPVGARFHSEGPEILSLNGKFTSKKSSFETEDCVIIYGLNYVLSTLERKKTYTEGYPRVPQKVTLF